MIVLIAQHFVQEGREEEVASLLREMSAYCNSDAEPGCLLYIVNQSTEDPRHFLIYEQYADQEALTMHAETPIFQEKLVGKEFALLERRERSFWNVVE
jgi:autoinducer 2-degrading protein